MATEILAAGAVLWRPAGPTGLQIALVHRPRHDDWSLPKGKLEPGETLWAAAAREVAEETGFTAVLGRHLTQTRYRVPDPVPADKRVDYVSARARDGRFQPNDEVDRLDWVSPHEAAGRLSYPRDVEVLRAFSALPAHTTTVLLVRHGKAGQRSRWPGPDELRPLSANGWTQVKALRALLPLFGADRVHSAGLVRCVQSVRAVADDIGTRIIDEPLLSEEGYQQRPAPAMARLLRIAGDGGTPVVCSQGGVIPDLVSRLAIGTGLELDEPDSRKGSVWVLSFLPGPDPRLVAASYIPEP